MTEPASPPPPPPPATAPRVHAALLLVQVIFGGFHVVAKAVLGELPPLALAGIRVALATPLLVLVAWRHDRVLPARRDIPLLVVLGILGVTANQLFFITGLEHTTAINASILMPSMPVFTAATAALLGIERIGSRRLLGIALSVAGALVLVNPFRFTGGQGAALGNLLILINCLSYSLFLVFQRPLLERLPWRTLIAASFVFGSLGVLVVSAPSLAALDFGAVSAPAWLGVLYIALLSTAFAYSISTWAVRRSSPALVSAYSTLQPLATSLLAATLLGERFGWAEGVGLVLIVAGLWQVSRPQSPARSTRSPTRSGGPAGAAP
jgi:drug/metabolite transporter (DMT)-like permease